ncbi:hypothetical protein LguiA_031054 [Lonicera macranthoides]
MKTSEMDFGFSLGCSNQSVRSGLNNDAGVGVNATPWVNMSFVASEPLLELVWSPGKGLSLKCADYSLNKNSSSRLWDVEQSNMVLSPWDSVRPINERTDGNIKEANTVDGVSVVNNNQEQEYNKVNEMSEPLADQENQWTTNESNLPSPVIGHSKLALDIDESKNNLEMHGSPIALLPEKLHSTSENKGKGKEKAPSDRETNNRMSKENNDDDSNGSMENCSSAVLFSNGNKQLRLERELIVGCKRIKKQVQESSFMNWIANMVTGLPKTNQEMDPAFDHPNHDLDCDEKIITSNKSHEPEIGNAGFQTVCESLYSQNAKVNERRLLNEDYPLTSSKEDKTWGDIIICNTKKPQMDTGCSLDLIWRRRMVFEKRILCSEEIQKPKVPLCMGMFDTISRLRLSRLDILNVPWPRWKNSNIPLTNLGGFFLRLRLRKSEGLGGTGYYVACINGTQRENPTKNSKNLISVSVKGINCAVESQYVSNHDFIEDELMAWWEITSKSGKIPTEVELKSKFEERKKLGF